MSKPYWSSEDVDRLNSRAYRITVKPNGRADQRGTVRLSFPVQQDEGDPYWALTMALCDANLIPSPGQ